MMLRLFLDHGFTAERPRKPAAFWRRMGAIAGLAVMALCGAASLARAAAPEEKIGRMLALVNSARAESGLAALTLEPRLMLAACRHAQDLAQGGPLSHRGRDGSDVGDRILSSGYDFAMAAENLAAGVPTPDETVWLWLGSPGHRRNILTAEFDHAGIANIAKGDVWVLVFGRIGADRLSRPVDKSRQPAMINGC